MALWHEAATLGAFVCCEAVFHQIEHWFEHRRETFQALRHGTFLTLIFHPSLTSGLAEWVNHVVAAIIATH